jgi:hypothetical protein
MQVAASGIVLRAAFGRLFLLANGVVPCLRLALFGLERAVAACPLLRVNRPSSDAGPRSE